MSSPSRFSDSRNTSALREPHHTHEYCDPNDIADIIFPLRVRLAGWSRDGKRFVGLDDDIARYQRLERPFVEWRDQLEAAAADTSALRDEHGMSDAMRMALKRFQTEGGHAYRLPPEKIRTIMENGVVAFLELEVRENVHLTLGSVSALSHAPWSTLEESKRGPHAVWPQYDWRMVMPQGAPDDQVEDDAKNHLLIVRSSVLPKIEQKYFEHDLRGEPLPPDLDGRDLRRLGLAARGKYENLRIAQAFGQERLSFNIGTLGIPGERSLNCSNQPSEAHNDWMQEVGWRTHVDTIIPGNDVHKAIVMYWKRYVGSISRGIDEFTLHKGLLVGKGYVRDEIYTSAHYNAERIKWLIEKREHAPW